MRAIALALFLCAAPAWATNVLFAPYIDPLTHQRDILYLTDRRSVDCSGEWRAARVEKNHGGAVPTTPICWAFGSMSGYYDIAFASTGMVNRDVGGFALVPGAQKAWQAVLAERMQAMEHQATRQRRAWGPGLAPHP